MQEQWYGCDWKSLRSNLVKLSIQVIERFVEDKAPGGMAAADIGELEARLHHAVNDRIAGDRLTMWSHALPLCVGLAGLADNLAREIGSHEGVSWQRRAGAMLKQHFETARREILAADKETHAHRIKTWERLDQISRKVARTRNDEGRCTEAHFQAVSDFVRVEYPRDKNLPKKLSTIETYFWEFSDECVEVVSSDATEQLPAAEIADLFVDVGIPELGQAIYRLDEVHRDVISFEYELELSGIRFMTRNDLLVHHKLSEQEYDHCVAQGLSQLRQGLELLLR